MRLVASPMEGARGMTTEKGAYTAGKDTRRVVAAAVVVVALVLLVLVEAAAKGAEEL